MALWSSEETDIGPSLGSVVVSSEIWAHEFGSELQFAQPWRHRFLVTRSWPNQFSSSASVMSSIKIGLV